MKKVIFLLLIFICTWLPSSELDCFTIIAGKNATADGSVILAHNEDDSGENIFLDVHRLASRFHALNEIVRLKNGASIPQIKKTFGFLWLQLPGLEFADSYFNENRVVVASNACLSREDKGELNQGGIGFMLRCIIAQRALSARHAVKIATGLLNEFGYTSSGRTYCIADSKEGWILHVVKGKHWIAQRVPDDQVTVISNYYTIENVNSKDSKNFLSSAELISYAVKRGWYNPQRDGKFDFARVYSDPANLKSMGNILRQWRATSLLSGEKFDLTDRFPFSFVPRKKIKLSDCFRILRDHYEDTEYDLTDHYRKGSPNKTKNRTICTNSTRYSFVAHLRTGLPKEIASTVWIAFSRPDANAYSPWYFPDTTPPSGYTRGNTEDAQKTHFSKPGQFFSYQSRYAYCCFSKLSELVDLDYRNRIRITRKTWNNFEDFVFKNSKKMDKEFLYIYKRNQPLALKVMTNYVHNLEYRKWFLADELIRDLTAN
jgi:dipeptidase